MKVRPILMSAPMVRALLDGRKTQTRRIVKPQPEFKDGWWQYAKACPYGQVGDLLWVRETAIPREKGTKALYKADYSNVEAAGLGGMYGGWKPSIHMRRALSRITLDITDIRVQRLQEISEEDARAEGCVVGKVSGRAYENMAGLRLGGDEWRNAKDWYADLWDSINGAGSWDANPWVWAISFTVYKQNVGAFMI